MVPLKASLKGPPLGGTWTPREDPKAASGRHRGRCAHPRSSSCRSVQGLGFRVWGFQGLGFTVWGFQGLGFRVWGLDFFKGFKVLERGFRILF